MTTDLLIRNVDPKLKRELEQRVRAHGRSLSEEAKAILQRGLDASGPTRPEPAPDRKLGTWMRSLVRPDDRGDDLVFESRGEVRRPPLFD